MDNKCKKKIICLYLDWIRTKEDTNHALTLTTLEGGHVYEPNVSNLGLLLKFHLTLVLFNNLSQHIHPAAKDETEEDKVSSSYCHHHQQRIKKFPVTNITTLKNEQNPKKLLLTNE